MTYKKVKLIEKMPLSLDQRVELLLIYANQKPATILYVESKDNLDPISNMYLVSETQLNRVLRSLKKLNLSYKSDKFEILSPGRIVYSNGEIIQFPGVERVPVYVAQNLDLLTRLENAYYNRDETELGRLFGFPETAIQAYLGERNPFMGDLDNNDVKGYFTQFIFSQDFFKEEYNSTSLRWYNTLKKLSPKMYEEINYMLKHTIILRNKIAWR